MIGEFTAFYLDEIAYRQTLDINKKFEPHYIPHLVIKVINHYNDSTFSGIICMDTRVFNRAKCITKHNSTSVDIIQKYNNNEPGYFTFDGITFFRIINTAVQSDGEGLYIFTFRYLNSHNYFEKNTAFMVMPFRYEQLNQFYTKNIKNYLLQSDLKIHVYRSDDFIGTDVVADTILEQIKKAEFIICDITNCNKNVFFEIGFAKGINKDIIFLLEQNKPAEFFDVNHIRRIEYSYEREEDFQKLLHDTLISVRNTRLL